MNGLLQTGNSIVILALISYSIAIFTEQRKKILRRRILVFLTLGIALDITATAFMILGSAQGGFTLLAFLAYSSLAGMFIDAVLIWRLKIKNGSYCPIPDNIHIYSRYAYLWWILAFISRSLLVVLS